MGRSTPPLVVEGILRLWLSDGNHEVIDVSLGSEGTGYFGANLDRRLREHFGLSSSSDEILGKVRITIEKLE